MTLRDLLEPVNASQMVRIMDGFNFVCDICGGLTKQNTELLSKYLDRNVTVMYPSIFKDENDEVMIYFHVRLDDSHVTFEMDESVDILPCDCGNGLPTYSENEEYDDFTEEYNKICTLVCTKCGRSATYEGDSIDSKMRAATLWNDQFTRIESER